MNQGAVAGAGIAAHLHQHIVPRWAGDTNFKPVIGRTKTLPQLLGDTRGLFADAWGADKPVRRRPTGDRSAPATEPKPAKRAPRKSAAANQVPARAAAARRATG
jgi:diadenosine tetraphosphate (Ap4A) HIT family hydrolase